MATNTLTHSQCRGFKPQAKDYKKFDGEGLVNSTGSPGLHGHFHFTFHNPTIFGVCS